MDLDRARVLISEIEERRIELAGIFGTVVQAPAPKTERAPQKCSKCNQTGHTARTCPNNQNSPTLELKAEPQEDVVS
jgi:hypothetical protein